MMADSQATTAINLLFQRPLEPVFTPRNDGTTVFDVPDEFLTDRYKMVGPSLQNRLNASIETRIPLRSITQPDISFAMVIRKDQGFSLFNEKHRDIAGRLVEVFMNIPDTDSLISALTYAKDRLNVYLFQYVLSVTVSHRSDTKHINVPSVVQIFPDQFVDPAVFPRAREEGQLINVGDRMPIQIPQNFTASDLEVEQRLAYWREDIGLNAHHWHWHLVFPGSGPDAVVRKDRRGELFYYMHQQIQSRYNCERFSNKLGRVKRFVNFREAIPEGYFPKIIRSALNRAYPPRMTNAVLQDVDREDVRVEVADLDRWRDRIYEAIDQGFIVTPSGTRIALDEEKGIDILGDIIEASTLSPNRQLYGNLHNEGHNIISFVHDPDSRHLEDYAVIGDVTTAMRDPAFYRFHDFINFVFTRHKNTLSPYTDQALGFDGVTVQSITTLLSRGQNAPNNTLVTFWQRSEVDLAAGLDFGPDGDIYAQFTHLQHAPFSYRVQVENAGGVRKGTCRIFMGPKQDERGTSLSYRDQRILMLEMDKFSVTLNPGSNTIIRRSDESSITIPFERTFRRVGAKQQPTDATALTEFQFCGCGWPQHLLVPKGTPEGMQFDLFVMISDFTLDSTNQDLPNSACNDSVSFCGLRDRLYPDRKPMGYPFDRNNPATTLTQFTGAHSNMAVQQVQVRFSNTIVNKS